MMEESDVSAIARVRGGDQDAYRVLVERHSARIFQLAYRMTGSEHDAEDVVQETFLRAYRQLDKFEDRAGFATWLHRIAANCSIDLLRKRNRRNDSAPPETDPQEELLALPAGAPTPDRMAANAEMKRKVECALRTLTSLERAAFILRHFEERSIEEISSTLGISSTAAKQSIFRAVQKMRRTLEPLVKAIP